MDRSHGWKKNEKMAKKNFAFQFPNIYCSFLFKPLKHNREISRQKKSVLFN